MPAEQPIDLRVYPTIQYNTDGFVSTIGDLHGNSVLMLYFLIQNQVIFLENGEDDYRVYREAYDEFVDRTTCFLDPEVLTTDYDNWMMTLKSPIPQSGKIAVEHLQFLIESIFVGENKDKLIKLVDIMQKVIDNSTINKNSFTRFIGDILADRGACDYFLLKIFEKIGKEVPDFKEKHKILYSNHDDEFIHKFYFDIEEPFDASKLTMGPFQSLSLQTLGALIKFDIVKAEEVKSITEKYYLPMIKLIDYSDRKSTIYTKGENIRIYMHAYNSNSDLNKLFKIFLSEEQLAKAFDSVQNFKKAVDVVNDKFNDYLKLENKAKYNRDWPVINHPIEGFIWVRTKSDDFPFTFNSREKAVIIHGHDRAHNSTLFLQDPDRNVLDLNGTVGKASFDLFLQYYPEYSIDQLKQKELVPYVLGAKASMIFGNNEPGMPSTYSGGGQTSGAVKDDSEHSNNSTPRRKP